jgi:hypothetical protein
VVGGGAYEVLIHQFLPARNRALAVQPGPELEAVYESHVRP